MNKYTLLFISLFFLINQGALSLEQNNVVCDPVLEGLPLVEGQSSDLTCKSCECVTESFSKNPVSEQDTFREVLGAVLRSRLESEVFPNLIRKIQAFEDAPVECSLDRLNQVSCSGEKAIHDLHQASLNQFLNWEDNVSCFPNATIEKALSQSRAKENLTRLRLNIEQGGDILYMNDPILKIYHENQKQFSSNQSYNDIKEQIAKEPLKSKLQSSLKDNCNKTFSEVEQVYCQNPQQIHLGADLTQDEQLMSTMLNFGEDQLSSARYKSVACQERSCLDKKTPNEFCRKLSEATGYNAQELMSDEPLYKSNIKRTDALSAAAVDYSEFCHLLTCADTDEAVSIIFGETQKCSKQASPKKSLGSVIADLNCKISDPEKPVDELCSDPHFASLVEAYDEHKDEQRPRLAIPEGKTYDDLNQKEREEILISAGYRPEELRLLGDFGVKKIFNQEVVFTGAKLDPAIAQARQAAQEQAQTVLANNESRAKEQAAKEGQAQEQKTMAAQKERETQRQAMAQQRAQRLAQAQETREQQQREFAQGQQGQFSNQPDQAYQTALADLNRDIQKELARQSGPNDSRALNRVNENSNKSLNELKGQVEQLQAQANDIKTEQQRSAYEQQIRDLKNEVNSLRSGQNTVVRNPTSTRSNNQVEARSALPDDDLIPREAAIFAAAAARGSNEASRAPAIVDEGPTNSRAIASNGQAVSYFERTSEELPYLTLEALSEVQPGENFVLGIRDGQMITTVEMTPEAIGDKILYRADFPEDLSFEAKVNMMKSPFFQSYLHPDSAAEVFDPEERARHSGLLNLLELKQ